ncbi:MAG: RluA family pseudouridine synthase [Pirellulales bacterium]|nr:RluA family pseudouridine synthase [Pirellulales bacterium]
MELEILYEEGPCLVFNKPAGLPTQAPPGIESLELRIKRLLGRRTGRAVEEAYLGVPHRLDRAASGAIVFATKRRPTRRLAEQFEERTVRKIYWAAVEGRVEPAEGAWHDHLRKIYGRPQAEVVPPDHPDGRPAVLYYRVLNLEAWGSLLEIRLETGRTHQVRVQAASRGHPLLGDALYGSVIPFGPQHEDQRLRAIALHARLLEFRHPVGKQPVSVTAPAGENWKLFIRP